MNMKRKFRSDTNDDDAEGMSSDLREIDSKDKIMSF